MSTPLPFGTPGGIRWGEMLRSGLGAPLVVMAMLAMIVVPLPPNGSAGVIYADHDETTAFLGYEGYLSPDTLYTYDSSTGDVKQLRQLPAWFNADPYQVDQFEATFTGENARRHSPRSSTFIDGVKSFWERMTS